MKKLLAPEEREFAPTGQHPLLDNVNVVEAISEYPADAWEARPKVAVSAVIELAHESLPADAPHAAVLWLANYGRGQIIISGYASPFVNKLIGKRDNARFLSNIIAWSLEPKGTVFIDDAHQGAVSFYDPQAFFGDARLHHALEWIVLLWLVFVLGPLRLRRAISNWNPVDILSFVRATGGFMARTLSPTEAGRRDLLLFFNAIRRRLGLAENGAPVWEWLESQVKVAPADLSQLRHYHEKISDNRRIDFAELHNLLSRIRECFI